MEIKTTNQASQFLNEILSNDDFSMNCTQQMYADPTGVADYIKKQGYELDGDDLIAAYQTESNDDIYLWTGIYQFNKPEDYKVKKLKIVAKEQKVFLDNSELDVTSQGNKTFMFQTGGNTVTITFSEHINDNGTVAPNTFQGKIEIPQSEPPSKFEDIQGEQIVYEEKGTPWDVLAVIGFASAIATLLGIPLMLKGYRDCCQRDTHSAAMIEMTERFDRIRNDLIREAGNRLDQQADGILERDRDAVVQEVGRHIIDQATRQAKDPNISKLPLEQQVARITQDSQRETADYIRDRIRNRYSITVTQNLEEIPLIGDMSTILNVKENIIQDEIDRLNKRVVDGLAAQEFTVNCIRAGVLEGHYRYLRDHAQEIQEQQTRLAEQQRKTRGEYDAANQRIADITEELRSPDLTEERRRELNKEMQEKVARRAELEGQRENEERTSREYGEDLDRTGDEERRNEDDRRRQREEVESRGGHVIFR